MAAQPKEILAATSLRQYPLPQRPWQHFQRWEGNIMLHWNVDKSVLLSAIPKGVELDLHNDRAYVSLFAFTVRGLRLRFLPPFPAVSDFHEINLRTYVVRDGKPGIFFFSIEAEKWAPVLLARTFIGLPYEKSDITRAVGRYLGKGEDTALDLFYKTGGEIKVKDSLDIWLTERHCLYDIAKEGLFRIDIHHKPWDLEPICLLTTELQYPYLTGAPERMHFSECIDVLVWNRKFIRRE